jgi:lycopene beta-cyclase
VGTRHDVLFIGGGLSSGLTAVRLRQRRGTRVVIVEREPRLGGQHTWSFHHHDLTADQRAWVQPFVDGSWPATRVHFPALQRRLPAPYYSLRSETFHDRVVAAGVEVVAGEAVRWDAASVTLADGRVFESSAILDARGGFDDMVPAAYQKFVGWDVTLDAPHNLTEPLLMDATVPQTDGFRFVYLLPWSADRVLIEDTYYSDHASLDVEGLTREIGAYAQARGWRIKSFDRRETGVLPIPLEGAPRAEGPVPVIGSRAGMFHATTGYSLPQAVRLAEEIADATVLSTAGLATLVSRRAAAQWREMGFCRLLNRLLFRAAPPAERYRVLEKFYRQPEPVIHRFYAGQLTAWDRARLLSGRPPVSIAGAIRSWRERRSAA